MAIMLRSSLPLVAGALCMPAAVQADFYSGDPYPGAKTWPMYTFVNNGGQTGLAYDNFNWVPGSGGGVVDVLGGLFHSFGQSNAANVNQCFWEIRTGMVGGANPVGGTPGTLLYAGAGTINPVATSFVQSGGAVWRFEIDVPDFTLAAGSYWLGVCIGSTNGPDNGWFAAQTDGTNGYGGPLGDNVLIYYQGPAPSWPWIDPTLESWWPSLTDPHADPSFFINEVPTPASGVVLLGGLLALRRRRPAR